MERCVRCRALYDRSVPVAAADSRRLHHFTGRYCTAPAITSDSKQAKAESKPVTASSASSSSATLTTGSGASAPEECGGELHDTIVYNTEKLDTEVLREAEHHASSADLHIVIGGFIPRSALCGWVASEPRALFFVGSSLLVPPAALLPVLTKSNGGVFVCINLQRTPKDRSAALKIHGECDVVMRAVAQELGITIPDPDTNATASASASAAASISSSSAVKTE